MPPRFHWAFRRRAVVRNRDGASCLRRSGVSPGAGDRELPEELAIKGSPVEPSVDYKDLTSVIDPGGFQEADAVLVVFQLAQQNYISNLRLCSLCKHFFYSSKRNQKFCPTRSRSRCRSRYWNATPKAKEARRKAAKKRRDKEKDKKRKYWAKQESEGLRKPNRRAHK